MKFIIKSYILIRVLLVLSILFSICKIEAQNSTGDLPLDKIKINGKDLKRVELDMTNVFSEISKEKEVVYRFNPSGDEKIGLDSTMNGWLNDSAFSKFDNRKLKNYWLGLKIEAPDQLFGHVLFLPIPNPYVTEVWINNKKFFDKKYLNSKDGWSELQNTIPVSLNKNSTLVYFKVSFTDQHSVFVSRAGIDVKTFFEFSKEIGERIDFVSFTSGSAFFYATITLLYFLLYFMGMKESKYLFGALFTVSCGVFLFVFMELINGRGIYSPVVIQLLFLSLLLTPISFNLFIISFFNYKMPKLTKWILIVTAIFIVITIIIYFAIDDDGIYNVFLFISAFLLFISLLISVLYPLILVFRAIKEKKNNAFIILTGMMIPLIYILIVASEVVFFKSNKITYSNNYYYFACVVSVPLSILISLVRGYASDNKNLKLQFSKVEELTAATVREQEEKQRILSNQNEILEFQVKERTVELTEQKKILEEKNHEILDSINYAKRIQGAILPPLRFFSENFDQSFVLYKPKDIVAGDFYWMIKKGGTIYYAAADCTGHGVPGAMVSVVCNNALNRSVNEFGCTDPAKILEQTRKIVIEEFGKSDEEVKDGMDISFCALDGTTLQWSGANNPLWIFRKETKQIEEIKPDKQPIGKYMDLKPFTTHEVKLNSGDIIYIFTDGYQDQFGGPKGKKFKAAQLKELLLEYCNLNMEDQKAHLESTFNSWKYGVEQVDDVCLIGVKIP